MIHAAHEPTNYTILPTLEPDSAGQQFRLVLRNGLPFGRVYHKAGTCRLEFNSLPTRDPIVRRTVGEIYAALMNGDVV